MTVRALLLLCLVSPSFADDRAEVSVKLDRAKSASVQPRLLFPRLPITLSKTPVDGLPKLSVAGRYATVHAGGRDLAFALDAPAGSHALGLLHTKGNKPVTGRAEAAGRGSFRVQFAGVVVDGVPLNVTLLYRGASVEATAEPAHHRRGRVVFEETVRVVLLIDNDGDGKFNGEEDRWIALREDRSRRVSTLRAPATLRLNEPQVPFAEDGSALMLREVAPDGSSAKLVRGKPELDAKAVLTRRYVEFRAEYFAAFLREGDAFARRSGLDVRRPRVQRVLDWPRESLERRRSARDGRASRCSSPTTPRPTTGGGAISTPPSATARWTGCCAASSGSRSTQRRIRRRASSKAAHGRCPRCSS